MANGSGVTTCDVNQLLKQFKEMQKMMRLLGKGAGGKGAGGKGRGGKGRPRMPMFG